MCNDVAHPCVFNRIWTAMEVFGTEDKLGFCYTGNICLMDHCSCSFMGFADNKQNISP